MPNAACSVQRPPKRVRRKTKKQYPQSSIQNRPITVYVTQAVLQKIAAKAKRDRLPAWVLASIFIEANFSARG
jgi:hypothetical protein